MCILILQYTNLKIDYFNCVITEKPVSNFYWVYCSILHQINLNIKFTLFNKGEMMLAYTFNPVLFSYNFLNLKMCSFLFCSSLYSWSSSFCLCSSCSAAIAATFFFSLSSSTDVRLWVTFGLFFQLYFFVNKTESIEKWSQNWNDKSLHLFCNLNS